MSFRTVYKPIYELVDAIQTHKGLIYYRLWGDGTRDPFTDELILTHEQANKAHEAYNALVALEQYLQELDLPHLNELDDFMGYY